METDPSQNQNKGLHQCPECESGLVQPARWQQASSMGQWRVWLRCPECEWGDDSIPSKEAIDDFDRVLGAGTAALERTLSAHTRGSMEEEAALLSRVLKDGLISADDFRN